MPADIYRRVLYDSLHHNTFKERVGPLTRMRLHLGPGSQYGMTGRATLEKNVIGEGCTVISKVSFLKGCYFEGSESP